MRVDVNGVRIFFEVVGTRLAIDGPRMREKPTLLLLHGGPGINDHSAYRPMFESLADVAQLILIDHRGNGRSDRGSRAQWNLAQWGDDLRAFCDALEIQRPIVLGNSFGGMVAISYATRHPDHPGKLILSSTLARSSSHYLEASVAMFTQLGGEAIGQQARTLLTAAEITPEMGVAWREKAMPFYTQRPSLLTDPDAIARTVVKFEVGGAFISGEMRTFDLLADLGRIRCPTLVLAGELDPICPIEGAEDIARAVPPEWLTYRRYPKCGHGAYRDVPEAFDEIRRFVEA
jgi:pimeloyl-ACP methyl ester carboxylesterase